MDGLELAIVGLGFAGAFEGCHGGFVSESSDVMVRAMWYGYCCGMSLEAVLIELHKEPRYRSRELLAGGDAACKEQE